MSCPGPFIMTKYLQNHARALIFNLIEICGRNFCLMGDFLIEGSQGYFNYGEIIY